MSNKVRVLIADDDPGIRQFISTLLSSIPQSEIVGEAGNGEEAVEGTKNLNPDVLLLDINMPTLSGLDALKRIKENGLDTIVVMLTAARDATVVKECIKNGAANYILKQNNHENIRSILNNIFYEAIRNRIIPAS